MVGEGLVQIWNTKRQTWHSLGISFEIFPYSTTVVDPTWIIHL